MHTWIISRTNSIYQNALHHLSYPVCLIGASLMMGNLLNMDKNINMAYSFVSSASDLEFDLYLDTMEQGNNHHKKKKTKQISIVFVKIMSSWIASMVVLLFIV